MAIQVLSIGNTKRCYAKAAADIQADGIIPSGQAFSYALQHVEKIHRQAGNRSCKQRILG